MLRSACAALLCVFMAAAAPRAADVPTSHPADVPTFAGIPWGASRTQVLEAAAASGLRVVATYGNDVELAGEPFGAEAVVHAMLSPTDGLVRVQVRFASSDKPMRTYSTVVESLTRLYGPTEPVELFKRPYVRGDGREDEAVLSGKGMLIAAWGDERQPGQAAVILHAGQPGVELEFESHAWKAESKRRRTVPSGPPAYASLAPFAGPTFSVGP
ncbi:MAG: hypothetical protein ABIT71_01120 [Vicinamibacteraceae bacterium]